MYNKIAIITLMRKGSKRLPGKNKLPFKGKPLYMHTVDFAVELSGEIGASYYLLHDYDDIPEIPGVTQITGLPDFGGDVHNTGQNILDSKIMADVYILLQPTSPLRNIQCIIDDLHSFNCHSFACGLSVSITEPGFFYNDHGRMWNTNNNYRNYVTKPTPMYKETGSYYFFKRNQIFKDHILLGCEKPALYKDLFDIDINTQEDYEELIKKYE